MVALLLKVIWLGLTFCAQPGQTVNATTTTTYVRTTHGTSGPVCEAGVRKCIKREAACVDGTCLCPGNAPWKGNFACYKPGAHHCEIVNDPVVHTFQGDSYKLPVTCRYLVTHFKTTFTAWDNSTCEVQVYAYNSKHFGKIYVQGFDLALRINTPVTELPVGGVSIRKYGTAFRGVYTFDEVGALQFAPNGPWTQITPPVYLQMPETLVRSRHDPYNNFAEVEAEHCGFGIKFRPFDTAYGKDQVQMPGLSVTVNPSYDPKWLSLDKVMSLAPGGEPTVDKLVETTGLCRMHAMILRLFQSDTLQNQPNAVEQCSAVGQVVKSCSHVGRRKAAFQTCTFILTTELFGQCYDSSEAGIGDGVLGLFKM